MCNLPKLDLNVTNRCNFKCVHCAFDSGKTKIKEFSLERIEQILKDTKELRGQRIDITGGEPLVREDVDEIIKIGKKLGYKIELVTNGSLLTKKKLVYFKKLGLDAIAISLDGSTYKIYSKIRLVNKESYSKVLKAIENAVNLGFYTKVNTVAFDSNMEDIPNITKFCIKKKVKEHGIYYFTPIGRGNHSKEKAIEPLKWLNFIRKDIISLDKKIKVTLEFPLIEKSFPRNKLGCIANCEKYHLQILPDGNVYPCAILASYKKPIANLHDVSVKDIWQNKKLWEEYWKDILKSFNCGYCINFKGVFKLKNYNFSKYKFVCPLRKFRPGEI